MKLFRSPSRTALSCAAITALVFLPALFGDFLDFDDVSNLVDNPYYRGFTRQSLRWIFGFHSVHYYPLTWLSFALDHALWGLDPFGFHLTNVLLHSANAALFALILLELLPGRTIAAFLGALLFSLHPLRVESVAWITERSDVLASFFYLLTALLYLRRRLGAALAAYACSLAAKATGVMLPLTLLILDAYPLHRFSSRARLWEAIKEKIPFLAAAAAAAALTFWAQKKVGSPWPLEKLGVLERLAAACYGFGFYLAKTFLPIRLLPLYPMPKPFWGQAEWYLLGAFVTAGLSVSFWLARRRRPGLLASWGHYILTLLPVCGLVQTGPQLQADRYSYLSCLGWAALAAGALASAKGRYSVKTAALLLAVLAVLTWRQCGVWHDPERFWSYQARQDARHAIARNFLGDRMARGGRPAQGEALLREALALDPAYGAAHNNLANLLANQGRAAEALEHYKAAILTEPQHPVVRHNLALALARLGRREEAIEVLRQELLLSPDAQPSKALLRQLQAK